MKTQRIVSSFLLFLSLSLFSNRIILSQENTTNLDNLNSWTTPLESKSLEKTKEKSKIPLFKRFPNLAKKISHIKLGNFPTPIKKLENLGKEIGLDNFYLKNDGISSKPFGGNKIRKLEFLLADALDNNVKTVITVGDAGSNHALATIVSAQKLGLKTVSMLSPQLNTTYLHRNLLLSLFYGGQINYFESEEERDENIINILHEKIKQEDGVAPYFIPSGGSCPIGSIGFVNAVFELKEQIDQGLMPEPDYIYVTLGSSGTAAGIALGLKLARLKSILVPVRISGESDEKKKVFTNLFNQTNELLNKLDSTCSIIKLPEEILINNDFAGEEYALITTQARNAIKQLFEAEDIKLEGTYTGKTFAALLNDIKNKKELQNKTILFWDTFCSGNFSEITKNVDYKQLPKEMYFYFEQEVQELDLGC